MAEPHNHSKSATRSDWLYARGVWVPTLMWNSLLGRILKVRAWWTPVDDHVIIGALPFKRDAKPLSELGVTGVVNTCEEYRGPIGKYDSVGIEQLRVPTVDFTHPSLDTVVKGVEFIERKIEEGGKVYVHCKAGRGRSATVVMGYLMKRYNLTPQEAQERLKKVRPHVNPGLADRPVVKAFYDRLLDEGSAAS